MRIANVHKVGRLLLLTLLLGGVPTLRAAAAEITESNVAEHIAAAKTPADHTALAAYYRAEAAAQGERVKVHEAMLASYRKSSGKPYLVMIDHCNAIIAKSRDLQKDYEMMAKMHEEMAK